jgi:hypothetical protein
MPARSSLLASARLFGGGMALATSLVAALAVAAEPTSSGKAEATPPAPEPVTARIGLDLGPSVRIGEAPAFAIRERSGLALGVSAVVAPTSLFDVGLAYERVELGREHGGGTTPGAPAMSATPATPDWVDVARTVDALWASVALRLVRAPEAKLSIVAGASLVWQHADASGALSQGEGTALLPFQCSASDSVNFGFRAGLGAEIPMGSGFVLLADAFVDNVRLSSTPLGGCVPGAGTTALFSGRLGFAYRFDVSRFVR